jgi:N-acetylglutamate synthase-like GNAT family acetyltransferase
VIEYRWIKPPLNEYKQLLGIVDWTSVMAISDETLRLAIENSWQWVSVFDGGRLIGIGRLISDGALYALVCDMIVLPEYQNRGIGSSILKMLKDKCAEHNIQRVWLFSAPGRSDFYLRNGFEIRTENAPGMQMKKIC